MGYIILHEIDEIGNITFVHPILPIIANMVKQVMEMIHKNRNGLHKEPSLWKLIMTQIKIMTNKVNDINVVIEHAIMMLSVVDKLIKCVPAMLKCSELAM